MERRYNKYWGIRIIFLTTWKSDPYMSRGKKLLGWFCFHLEDCHSNHRWWPPSLSLNRVPDTGTPIFRSAVCCPCPCHTDTLTLCHLNGPVSKYQSPFLLQSSDPRNLVPAAHIPPAPCSYAPCSPRLDHHLFLSSFPPSIRRQCLLACHGERYTLLIKIDCFPTTCICANLPSIHLFPPFPASVGLEGHLLLWLTQV